MERTITQKYINEISYEIIGCAIEVHKHMGPGLLESVYEPCFIDELKNEGMNVKSQLDVPIKYKGKDLGGYLKLDLLIEDLIIVEEKSVETMIPLCQAQLLSYLKLAEKPKGLLINFNHKEYLQISIAVSVNLCGLRVKFYHPAPTSLKSFSFVPLKIVSFLSGPTDKMLI